MGHRTKWRCASSPTVLLCPPVRPSASASGWNRTNTGTPTGGTTTMSASQPTSSGRFQMGRKTRITSTQFLSVSTSPRSCPTATTIKPSSSPTSRSPQIPNPAHSSSPPRPLGLPAKCSASTAKGRLNYRLRSAHLLLKTPSPPTSLRSSSTLASNIPCRRKKPTP